MSQDLVGDNAAGSRRPRPRLTVTMSQSLGHVVAPFEEDSLAREAPQPLLHEIVYQGIPWSQKLIRRDPEMTPMGVRLFDLTRLQTVRHLGLSFMEVPDCHSLIDLPVIRWPHPCPLHPAHLELTGHP